MHAFKDTEGRPWELRINGHTIKLVRDLLGIDLPGLYGDGMKRLGEWIADPIKRIDTLFVLCKVQAEKRQITDESFAEAFYGDALESATEAFLQELANFSPGPKAKAIRAMLLKMQQTTDRIVEKTMANIETIDPAQEADALLATLAPKSSTSCGIVVGSSE